MSLAQPNAQATIVSTPLARATPAAPRVTYQPRQQGQPSMDPSSWGEDLIPGQAPSTIINVAEGSYGFNYAQFDVDANNRRLDTFKSADDQHMYNRDNYELDPATLKYVPYLVPGESEPRQVQSGMVPSLDAFYSGRITQDQLEAEAINLTPTVYRGESSVFGMIFREAVKAVIAWGVGQALGPFFSTVANAASDLTGSSFTGTSDDSAGSGLPGGIDLMRAGANVGRGVIGRIDAEDARIEGSGEYEIKTWEDDTDTSPPQDAQNWWEQLRYPRGIPGLLEAREDGWRAPEEGRIDPTWNRDNIYGDGLQRSRSYRDPITGEVRRVGGGDGFDPIGPLRIPWEILTAGAGAISDWVKNNNDHISRESVFDRRADPEEPPEEEQAPLLGQAPRVDGNGPGEENRSVFQPPVIIPPQLGEPPRRGVGEEEESRGAPIILQPITGPEPPRRGVGEEEEGEERDPPTIIVPQLGGGPGGQGPRAPDTDPWDEWERDRIADEERRRANIGGRVDLGTTGNKLKYREGYAGFAGGETGRSVFSGPGRYSNPLTQPGILNRTTGA